MKTISTLPHRNISDEPSSIPLTMTFRESRQSQTKKLGLYRTIVGQISEQCPNRITVPKKEFLGRKVLRFFHLVITGSAETGQAQDDVETEFQITTSALLPFGGIYNHMVGHVTLNLGACWGACTSQYF